MRETFKGRRTLSEALNVLGLLVESGALCCGVWVGHSRVSETSTDWKCVALGEIDTRHIPQCSDTHRWSEEPAAGGQALSRCGEGTHRHVPHPPRRE